MTVSYKLAILCETCGHPRYMHGFNNGNGCSQELKDWDGSFLRCGCYFFIPVAHAIEPSEVYL